MMATYEEFCSGAKMSDYELKYVKYMVNACEAASADIAVPLLKEACKN